MARSNLGPVLDEVFKHEGGYVDHPRDPGGATNLGITHLTLAAWRGRKVSKADVKNLTRQEAEKIYRANYWNKVRAEELPAGLDLVAMDGAVNSGPRRGIRWLQVGVKSPADGKIGPNTIAAAMAADEKSIERACDARMGFLQGLRHWDAFGRGWSRRVASVEAVGTRMWLKAAGHRLTYAAELKARQDAAPGKAQDERRNGGTQASVTGAGGVGGVSVAELPLSANALLALGIVVVAALLYIRAERKARYHEDRRDAYAAILEEEAQS